MDVSGTSSRRSFLFSSAATAAAVVLTACAGQSPETAKGEGAAGGPASSSGKGSATKPVAPPATFSESPLLADQVKAGRLPEVGKRLPANPYVVPHNWLTKGKYGGSLKLIVPATDDLQIKQYMYGHSPLRFLNDSLDVGPGLVESWESNEDQSEWTLHFRSGLRWSDGKPWTTADVMFWWKDMVLNEDHTDLPPDECKSAKGTVAEITAPDEVTLVLRFDTPAPLTPDRLAGYSKRGNGSTWMEPKHYLQRFHPTYTPSATKDWASAEGEFEHKRNHATNPDCPTMTGWRLASYKEGRQAVWERNPYYWAVDKDGQQLPFLDKLTFTAIVDPQVGKLQMQVGKVDYVHGPFVGLTLADVSSFKQVEARSKLGLRLWDGGSGTGSMFFFNYDYKEPKMRELIAMPKFRQALSLAFNRADVKKSIYFTMGEETTGTLGVKSIEYSVDKPGRDIYAKWRDSYVKYDPDRAKALLDEIGAVDKDGDGVREMPDGSPLVVRIDYRATASPDHIQKNEMLKRDWEAVGVKVQLNPVPPDGWDSQWESGALMSNGAWEASNARDHLTQAAWLVPVERTRWAPLHGQFYNVRGTPEETRELDVDPYKRTPPRVAPKPGGPVEQLWKLYDQAKVEPDPTKRHKLVRDMIEIHIEHGPFIMGCVANTPQVILAHQDLRNVPDKENLAQGGVVNTWQHPTPAVYDPETYYWENPAGHA